MIAQWITIGITIAAEIHNGDKTHHQLQAIKFVNFNTTKTMDSNMAKPMPPPSENESDIMILVLFWFNFIDIYKARRFLPRPQ